MYVKLGGHVVLVVVSRPATNTMRSWFQEVNRSCFKNDGSLTVWVFFFRISRRQWQRPRYQNMQSPRNLMRRSIIYSSLWHNMCLDRLLFFLKKKKRPWMVLESRVRLLVGQSLSSTASPRRVSLSGSRAAEIKVNGISCPSCCCCGGGGGGRITTAAIAPDPRPLIHNIRDVAKPPAKQKKKKCQDPASAWNFFFFCYALGR